MAAPAKPRNNLTQDIQESGAILIVVKDRFLAITSGSHMIKCAKSCQVFGLGSEMLDRAINLYR